eukprot:6636954-Heterocapsa_arctica.AAC.1
MSRSLGRCRTRRRKGSIQASAQSSRSERPVHTRHHLTASRPSNRPLGARVERLRDGAERGFA